jgi:predicted ATPase/DNA-binding CsgD family transcriptional regulator
MTDTPRAFQPATPTPLRATPERRPPPLPRPLTSFIGREREQRELTSLITREEVRLVTLVGPAGVGKTRLAVRMATELRAEFAAVGFASLAPIADPELIVPIAGNALGIREPTPARIADQLAGLPTLLVLDNLEQIPEAAGVLAMLLGACVSLTVLATSRTVLHVSGEHVYPVHPFTIEPITGDDRLTESPAIQLFVERARAADPTFTLDSATVDPVADICRQLDGLPLAIELAAGQVRMLSPQAILTRLDRRFALLAHGPEDQPERQRSLERAIRWSYDLLPLPQQRALRALGVFTGGFSEDAARQVALGGESPLPVLSALIDASLVLRSVQPDGEPRFALLESIRAFCLLELRSYGEESVAREAHAAYYLQLAANAEPRLIVTGSATWVRRLAVEHDNLRDAVEWSLSHDMPEPVLALAGTLLSMTYAQGEPAESRSWLERAIALAGPTPSAQLSDAHFAASALAQVQGDFACSTEHATHSLEIARAAAYPFGEGRALLGLGISAEWDHDLDLAEQRYRAAQAIMQTLDSTTRLSHWRVLPLANLADIALIRKRYREAIELGSEAVTAWREAGYLWGIAQALGTVAAARCELGDLHGARRDYRETLELWLGCADGRGIAGTIAGIAAVAHHAGDPNEAAALLGSAWGLRELLGLDFLAHHLYAEQVRAAVLPRAAAQRALAAAEAAGRARPLDDAVAAAMEVLAQDAPPRRADSRLALSPRELEVLACVVEGLHDREIADHLCISPRTVQSHVLAILNKLGARSRAEAVALALRGNLLP